MLQNTSRADKFPALKKHVMESPPLRKAWQLYSQIFLGQIVLHRKRNSKFGKNCLLVWNLQYSMLQKCFEGLAYYCDSKMHRLMLGTVSLFSIHWFSPKSDIKLVCSPLVCYWLVRYRAKSGIGQTEICLSHQICPGCTYLYMP